MKSVEKFARGYIRELSGELASLDLKAFSKFANELERICREGRVVFIMGNGGSAATASHMANDFAKTASVDGCARIRALSLADNVSLMTAISNDISYEEIFVEQLKTQARAGDLAVLITGSGNSPNVVKAARWCRDHRIKTVGLLGFDGGKLKPLVDICLHIKSFQYGVVEDAHLSIGHILTFLFKDSRMKMKAQRGGR